MRIVRLSSTQIISLSVLLLLSFAALGLIEYFSYCQENIRASLQHHRSEVINAPVIDDFEVVARGTFFALLILQIILGCAMGVRLSSAFPQKKSDYWQWLSQHAWNGKAELHLYSPYLTLSDHGFMLAYACLTGWLLGDWELVDFVYAAFANGYCCCIAYHALRAEIRWPLRLAIFSIVPMLMGMDFVWWPMGVLGSYTLIRVFELGAKQIVEQRIEQWEKGWTQTFSNEMVGFAETSIRDRKTGKVVQNGFGEITNKAFLALQPNKKFMQISTTTAWEIILAGGWNLALILQITVSPTDAHIDPSLPFMLFACFGCGFRLLVYGDAPGTPNYLTRFANGYWFDWPTERIFVSPLWVMVVLALFYAVNQSEPGLDLRYTVPLGTMLVLAALLLPGPSVEEWSLTAKLNY